MLATLSACSASEQANEQEQLTNTQKTEESQEVKEPMVENTESEDKPIEESSGETTEKVEENTSEATPVEMVDFETWAKQEGNDEICLVVWNEELGVQEIMPTIEETKKTYQIQDGDKFAIPFREAIIDIKINGETGIFPDTEYLELLLPQGELTKVCITYRNEEGEYEFLNYGFK